VADPKTLRVGDRIRILRVPDADLRQRKHEMADGVEMAGWTADSIERIIAQSPIVRICQIDEDGCVWYEASIIGPDGSNEEHTLIVYDDASWEPVGRLEGCRRYVVVLLGFLGTCLVSAIIPLARLLRSTVDAPQRAEIVIFLASAATAGGLLWLAGGILAFRRRWVVPVILVVLAVCLMMWATPDK
jgi:hypothetical protein